VTNAYPVILHHFEKSPFSEKIRVIFGLKQLDWTSVVISRIMPRPDLMPMTGGYRRTPVMQIGADIYCDTQCIIRELERRFPEPTLFPDGNEGMAWASAMWTDRSFFQNTVNLVFGTLADRVPQDFIADREQLRGAKFDVAAMTAAIPQMRDQFRAHLHWIETQLGDGRAWLAGGQASLWDVNAYMNVWYVREHLSNVDEMLGEFPRVRAWEARVRSAGHGRRTDISTSDALDLATRATPQTAELPDPGDRNGRKPGDLVEVIPDDYGKVAVRGVIVALSPQHIAVRRHDPRAGDVVVHFPRAGFLVRAAK
jgi:glutathione S-transferase